MQSSFENALYFQTVQETTLKQQVHLWAFCLVWVFTEKDWRESSLLAVNEVWKLSCRSVSSTSILTSLLPVGGDRPLTIVLLICNNSSWKGHQEVSSPIFYWEHHHWEVRPCGSGLSQVWSWEPLRAQSIQPFWTTCSTLDCSHGEKDFPLSPAWTCLVSRNTHCLLHYCQAAERLFLSSQQVHNG